MYEVIYFSRGGNTKKLATAIADELGVKSRHIRSVTSLPEEADLFLGSGLYLLRPSKLIRDFIRNDDFQGKKIALFGTSTTGIGIETMRMQKLLKRKGAIITGKYYCVGQFRFRFTGKFFFIRKGRPVNKDLEKAKEFVRSIVKKLFEIEIIAERQKEKHEDRILSRV